MFIVFKCDNRHTTQLWLEQDEDREEICCPKCGQPALKVGDAE